MLRSRIGKVPYGKQEVKKNIQNKCVFTRIARGIKCMGFQGSRPTILGTILLELLPVGNDDTVSYIMHVKRSTSPGQTGELVPGDHATA
jgi:hypothetical protein